MKGQAAMEYLMTYGWALLVIVIVLAVLLIINPFRSPEQCSFSDATLSCGKPLLSAADRQLYLQVTNGFSQAITVTGAICTNDRAEQTATSNLTINVPPQGILTAKKAPVDPLKGEIDITCTKISGGGVISPGEDYNGLLYIYYKLADDPDTYPVRVSKATMTTKAQ